MAQEKALASPPSTPKNPSFRLPLSCFRFSDVSLRIHRPQRPDLLRRLRDLVRIPTVNPPGEHYDEITALLARELTALGLQTRRIPIPATLLKRKLPPGQWKFPRYNVLGKLAVRGAKKTIHFNAHYDVVPVSGAWRHGGPFSGTVEDGWSYGRGTADMKGSMASLLLALQALRDRARRRG